MWRLWVLVLVNPIWGEEVFIDGEDVGYLERRLDDVKVLGDVAVRWRVRGVEGEWRDFSGFYYRVKGRKGEVVVGDLRPGFGAGVVFGRRGRGGVNAALPLDDSSKLGYRSSGENAALRGVAWRFGKGKWEGVLLGGKARRDGRLDEDEPLGGRKAAVWGLSDDGSTSWRLWLYRTAPPRIFCGRRYYCNL